MKRFVLILFAAHMIAVPATAKTPTVVPEEPQEIIDILYWMRGMPLPDYVFDILWGWWPEPWHQTFIGPIW